MNRVYITGIGLITPVGIGTKASWDGIAGGVCGVAPITRFDTSDYKVKLAAEVKDFQAADFIDKKLIRRNDRYTHYALAAAVGFFASEEASYITGQVFTVDGGLAL